MPSFFFGPVVVVLALFSLYLLSGVPSAFRWVVELPEVDLLAVVLLLVAFGDVTLLAEVVLFEVVPVVDLPAVALL